MIVVLDASAAVELIMARPAQQPIEPVEKALQEPLLYLSLYFKRNRDEYYEGLQRVSPNCEQLRMKLPG